MLLRFLNALALSLAASAGMIMFILLPYEFLVTRHLVPNWDVFKFIYLLAAILLAWLHAGGYITITVIVCEVAVVRKRLF